MQRRTFLKSAAALFLGTAGTRRLFGSPAPAIVPAGAGLRVAHVTDTHVFDDRGCPRSMEVFLAALAAVKPDLILHTGDVIMDATGHADRAPVDKQWALWRKLAPGFTRPVRYCLGNHDLWTGEAHDPQFPAKRLAMDQLGLTKPYYAFDQGGWRFVMLDSSQPAGNRGAKLLYSPYLDEAQHEWFQSELSSTPASTPMVVCSHVPILSASIFELAKFVGTPGGPVADAHWTVGAKLMHNDSREIQALLRRRQAATLCLSGHLHMTDQVIYDGLQYLGAGAVCGDWWRTPFFRQSAAGFAVFDLQPNGDWKRAYEPYSWPA